MSLKIKSSILLPVTLLAWLILYHKTLWSMVEIWWRSETFAHGFLIFPISLYLIWDKRAVFHRTEKKSSLFFSLCLLMLVFLWGLAKSVDVQVIQQLMILLMIPAIVGALYGIKLLKQYAFPLFYLLFAVPFGEFLIPKLQVITAVMTVYGLQITGVPVFSEGMFISIPEGDFEVAVACSGIRYLIASLALGTLYAYLVYNKLYKQVLFVAAAIIAPIVANGVRAYGIVMIAHLSDMKYATGTDHLIYGWLFFGVVIFILFYIGSFWQDKVNGVEAKLMPENQQIYFQTSLFSFAPVVILFIGPAMTLWMNYQPQNFETRILATPEVAEPWIDKKQKTLTWQPFFKNADSEVSTVYYHDKRKSTVYYYSSKYLIEAQDKELINMHNQIFSTDRWLLVSNQLIGISNKTKNIQLEEHVVRNNSGKLLIWSWYEVLGFRLTHPIKIKIAQAMSKLLGLERGGQFKSVAIPFDEDLNTAREQLDAFLLENKQILKTSQ